VLKKQNWLFLFWLLGQIKEISCILDTLIGAASRTLRVNVSGSVNVGWGHAPPFMFEQNEHL
jgi:hypothetical protein